MMKKMFATLALIFSATALAQNSTYIKGTSLYESVSSTVTSGSIVNLTCNSNVNQRFTGSTAQTVALPQASLCSKGRVFNIVNESSQTLTVTDYTTVTLQILPANTFAHFVLYDNVSSEGVWANSAPAGNRFEKMYLNEGSNNQDGTDVTLSAPTHVSVRLTNSALVNIAGITAGSSGQLLYLTNVSGVEVEIDNQNGAATAANRIITGTGSDLDLSDGASIVLKYDGTSSRWRIIGGSGSGGGSNPTTTLGDTIYTSITGTPGTLARLPIGSANQALVVDGTNSIPKWKTLYQTNAPNYLAANPDAEIDTMGCTTYADAAGNRPVDGTGGTATGLTFSRSTSSPLRGVAHFRMAQANATDIQGKGVSCAFTIDSSDQAKQLGIHFDFRASADFTAGDGTTAPLNDGTTSTNAGNSDVEVFVYDVTNSTLIYVNPQTITAKGSNIFEFQGSFQTAPNSTSYRLIYHVATDNDPATGWIFDFDNVLVSKLANAKAKRQVEIKYTMSGTPAVTGGTNIVWDTKEIDTFGGAYNNSTGVFTAPFSGTYRVSVGSHPSATVASNIVVFVNGSGVSALSSTSAGSLDGGSTIFKLKAGDTVELRPEATTTFIGGVYNHISIVLEEPAPSSSSTGTSVISAKFDYTGNQTVTGLAVTKLTGWAPQWDSHAAWDSTNNRYVFPESGYYQVYSLLQFSGTSGDGICGFSINGGTQFYPGTAGGSNTFHRAACADVVKVNAGDYIELYTYLSATFDIVGGPYASTFAITKVQGPSVQSTNEKIIVKYRCDNGVSIDTTQPLDCDNKVVDTHGTVTTGSAWKFTAPRSGVYRVNSLIYVGAAVTTYVYKNGTQYDFLGATNSGNVFYSGNALVELKAGEYIDFRSDTAQTTSSGVTFLEVESVN